MFLFIIAILASLVSFVYSGGQPGHLSCSYKDKPWPTHTGSEVLSHDFPTGHYSWTYGSGRHLNTRCPRVSVTSTTTLTETIFSGTTTITPGANFTPIRSETYTVTPSSSLQPRALPLETASAFYLGFDDKGHVTTSGDYQPASLTCGHDIDATPTTAKPAATTTCLTTASTLTKTVTTTIPNTAYKACEAANLVNSETDNGTVHGINRITSHNVTANAMYFATNAVDCCNGCQELNCAYGVFFWEDISPYCGLYFQDKDKCNGGGWQGNTFSYVISKGGYLAPADGFTVFNGPCGEVVYGGASNCIGEPVCD